MAANKYAGTQTEKNLQEAFAGESQARNKYTYFASVAKKEGYEQMSALFLKTADNEKEHAKMWFKSDEYEAEMMCLFTADGYTGELITCDEGELEWVKKSDVPQLPTWEGDAQFLKLLLEDEKRFFAMKLRYEGERLIEKSVEFCGG